MAPPQHNNISDDSALYLQVAFLDPTSNINQQASRADIYVLSLTYAVFAGYFAHSAPPVPLSWTTQQTSLLKSVGLANPSFISPAI